MASKLFYYILIILFYIFICGYKKLKNRRGLDGKIYLSLGILLFTFFAVAREVTYGIGGTDAITYVNDFVNCTGKIIEYINISRIIALKQREPFYYLLMCTIRNITSSYKFYFFVCYFLIVHNFTISLINIIEKCKIRYCLPCTLIMVSYIHSFNAMRNWLAISFCLLGICYYLKDNKKFALILTTIGVLFHYSCMVFFALYILYYAYELICNLKNTNEQLVLLLIAILSNLLFSIFQTVISLFMEGTKYRIYSNIKSGILGYIPIIFIFCLCLMFYKDLVKKNDLNRIIVFGLCLNVSLLYIYINMGGYRINDCFILFRVTGLCELLSLFRMKKNRLFYYGLNLFIVIYVFQQMAVLFEGSGILPYIWG